MARTVIFRARLVIAVVAIAILCQSAAAQRTVALSIEGWQQESGKDGIVVYRCASEICAAGSVVSYKQQPHHPVTIAEFETHHRNLARQNEGVAKVQDVVLSDLKERTIDGVRVLQVSRKVVWTDGTATFTIEARLIGPARSYSLVSDSPRVEWTTNNFEGFLRSLATVSALSAP